MTWDIAQCHITCLAYACQRAPSQVLKNLEYIIYELCTSQPNNCFIYKTIYIYIYFHRGNLNIYYMAHYKF